MANEIKDLVDMNEDDLFKQLGMKKKMAETALLADGKPNEQSASVENFKFSDETAALGIADFLEIGKKFFKQLSSSAFNLVCGSAEGSADFQKLIGKGETIIVTALASLIVAQLAIAAAVAAIAATLIVKLFFDAGGKVLCSEWKNSLPAEN